MRLDDFIDDLLPHAQRNQEKYGIPVSLTLGQAILESWKGNRPSGLAENANNYFGVKATASWKGPVYWAGTKEDGSGGMVHTTAGFRKYGSVGASVDDYGRTLLKWDVEGKSFAEALNAITAGKMKYATDRNYVSKVTSIVQSNNLTKYDAVSKPWKPTDPIDLGNITPRPRGGDGDSPSSSPAGGELNFLTALARFFILLVLFIMGLVFGAGMLNINIPLPTKGVSS